MAVSKSEIRSRYQAQIQALILTASAKARALRGTSRSINPPLDLGEWDGDLTDIEGIAKAFSRAEHVEDMQNATTDVNSPGNVGDLILAQMQGDYLACLERAFRSRYAGRIRRTAHAAARRAGHGDTRGVLQRGVQGYVEGILRQAKAAES